MKNKIPLIAALILGVVAVVAIRSYIKRMEEDAASKLKGRPVVAARTTIAEGTELQEGMLGMRTVPTQFIPPQAITSTEEMRQILGRRVRVPVATGQILLWSDLEIERRGGLSVLIPSGERAFTVDISTGINTALLQVNDRVDIIGIFAAPEAEAAAARPGARGAAGADMVCVVLLQNVTILAVGEEIGERRRGMGETGGGGAITFSVTLPEAQLLMFASQHGELALALRREGEVEILAREDLPRVTFLELQRITEELDTRRTSRIVQILRGQDLQEVQVESR